jgi:hypothetical protein
VEVGQSHSPKNCKRHPPHDKNAISGPQGEISHRNETLHLRPTLAGTNEEDRKERRDKINFGGEDGAFDCLRFLPEQVRVPAVFEGVAEGEQCQGEHRCGEGLQGVGGECERSGLPGLPVGGDASRDADAEIS